MSLPAAWVDRIFDKLTITYGRDFLSRWEGLDLKTVKSDWGNELSGLFRQPSSIAWAIDHLPERPPTVIDFRRLANTMPTPNAPQIAYEPASMELVSELVKKIAPAMEKNDNRNSLDWARRVIARNENGSYRATRAALLMARDALGLVTP